MKIHHLTIEEALVSVQSRMEGLSMAEAGRRLVEFGANQVESVRRPSLLPRLLKGFTHFFAVILWVAAFLSFLAEIREPGHGMLALACAIIGVILINGAFSFWQEFRAERAFSALKSLLPETVKVRREGGAVAIPAADLVPGDIVFLEAGDRVPADCRVLDAFSLRVNNATVTGESAPHSRDARVSTEADFLESTNVLLAGTSIVGGETTALVFATGAQTAFGRIAQLTQSEREEKSPLQKEVIRISRLVAVLALSLGIIFFFIGRLMGMPFWGNLIFAIGIIVANVPEGLLPTLTLALAMGSQRMARRNALVRHLPAVETLGAATVICTDKTGTLTENRLTAKRLWLNGQSVEMRDLVKARALAETAPRFFQIARQSHNLKPMVENGRPQWLGDPLELALMEMVEAIDPGKDVGRRLDEIPFDSRRRRMSTLHQEQAGTVLFTKGAPEAVLPLCNRMELNGEIVSLQDQGRQEIMAVQETMAREGLRVLVLAWRELAETDRAKWESELVFVGLIGLEDPVRSEVPAAVARCRAAGIRVIMTTGDHAHTAVAVAREIGLVRSAHPLVITGDQLRRLSNIQLQLALDAPEILFARVAADQKMRIVIALKRKKEIVAVTGDGVNDAPALKQADIGIAMGRAGTDVAREAADIILLDDNFATIVSAVEEGRAVYANIRKFLTYILTSNIPELVPYLAFMLFRIPLPLTVIQILAVDLGTDMVPALALGAEPPNARIMQEPPRPASERLLNFGVIARAYLWLGPIQAVAAMASFFYVLKTEGWHYGEALASADPLYLRATTACLCAIVLLQVVNVFLCRSERQSAFALGLLSNPLILVGLAIELTLILLITYTPLGNVVFGTAPIPLHAWLFILPFAAAALGLEELRKWIVRGPERNRELPMGTMHHAKV